MVVRNTAVYKVLCYMIYRDAVCCSVLHCGSVQQGAAVSVVLCEAAFCSVMQRDAVWCNMDSQLVAQL